jgi:ribosomal protein L11 methyltransferase
MMIPTCLTTCICAIPSETRDSIALMPDGIAPERVAEALGVDQFSVSPATGRDAGSTWILSPRATRVGRLNIVPLDSASKAGALRLIDSLVFGTGLHPTTALCLEALDEAIQAASPQAALDVGTGSGVLALGALMLGVPRALGLDLDDDSLAVAAENARINGLADRLELKRGGLETVTGTWPLIVANLLAASLVELAPAIVRRAGHHAQVILSGAPSSAESEVARAYRRLGLHCVDVRARAGWLALVLRATW